jgi:hypothetical protein
MFIMEKYNLDEKGGLTKLFKKKPSKFLLKDDSINLSHFSSFSSVKMKISDVTDTTIKLDSPENGEGLDISLGDVVALSYFTDKDYYILSGKVSSIEKKDPLELTCTLKKYGKTKDLRKENKKYVSFLGTMGLVGSSGKGSTATIKVMGLRAIKVECKDEFQIGNRIDVLANLDKKDKLSFKGEIAKKQKADNVFEYGIEVKEITESNSRLMHSCVGGGSD